MSQNKKWPFKYRFWREVHGVINRLAWRFAPVENFTEPRNNHWLWKLNDWAGNKYLTWWVTEERKS